MLALLLAAAVVPAHIPLVLTGDPATAAFVTERVAAAVRDTLAPELPPGATVDVDTIAPAPADLGRGFRTSFGVALRIVAPGTAPVATTTVVDVENAPVEPVPPALLAFNDDPERVAANGVLFRDTVVPGRPLRLYYYHEDRGAPRRFAVVLSPAGATPARVWLVDAAGGPGADVMSVGHAVSRALLTRGPAAEGVIVDVAAGAPVVVRDATALPGEVVAAALDVTVLGGGPVTLTVVATAPGDDPRAHLADATLPPDGHGRHGTFALDGFADWIVAYTVGGPDAHYTYGGRTPSVPSVDPAGADHDYGDYGVLQQITFDVANPTDSAATVFLYARPLGGDARAIFRVDGELQEIGCVRLPKRYEIASRLIPAHADVALRLETTTDGGSSFPLEIGATTTAPLPAAPAISAPDGCFPKQR